MKLARILRLAIALPVIATMLLLAFSAVPTRSAHACLPCDCTDIISVNCWGPYQLYTPTNADGDCWIDIWLIEGNEGRRYIRVRTDVLADYPEFPETNTLIRERGPIALYKLTSGEYQINVGPDAENKVHVINFTGCPAGNVVESTFVMGD